MVWPIIASIASAAASTFGLLFPISDIMGGNSSKDDIKQTEVINEKSEGFHLFELHLPSVGGLSITLLVFILLLGIFWYIFRRCKKTSKKKHNRRLRGLLGLGNYGDIETGLPLRQDEARSCHCRSRSRSRCRSRSRSRSGSSRRKPIVIASPPVPPAPPLPTAPVAPKTFIIQPTPIGYPGNGNSRGMQQQATITALPDGV